LEALAGDLCGVFLGWRLREDYDALLALGEGALHLDLRSAEAWCDDEPIPPLFIAGELCTALEKGMTATGQAPGALDDARLDALFSRQPARRRGRDVARLSISCRVTLCAAGCSHAAERHNGWGAGLVAADPTAGPPASGRQTLPECPEGRS